MAPPAKTGTVQGEQQSILLCWNRDDASVWPLEQYDKARESCANGMPWRARWSVGNRVSIPENTKCFPFVQGRKHPRGLVGLSRTDTTPSEDAHYSDPAKRTRYVKVVWEELLDVNDAVPVAALVEAAPSVPWREGVRGSGFPVRDEEQQGLLDLWREYSGVDEEKLPGELIPGTYLEGAVRTIQVNRYERDPKARAACLAHFGTECRTCGIDLKAIYGVELGSRAVHVHHIRPIATRGGAEYRIDPLKDLVPLCPNCHNVIHKCDPVLTPAQLKRLVAKASTTQR